MTRKTRVYVSGPMLTSGNPYLNVRDGIRAGSTLMRKGYLPFIPHLTAVWEVASPELFTRDDWMGIDLEYVRMSDAVLRLPGESRGADEEVALAKSLGIPVYYSIDTLVAGMPTTITIDPKDYTITTTSDFRFTREPVNEQEWILDTFLHMLQVVTGDGATKRARGEKPPWWKDNSHLPAIFSHLNKYFHGEHVDKDSNTHTFVHLAWRALAVAYIEMKGMVDPAAPLPEKSHGTNHRPGVKGTACNDCTCAHPILNCDNVGCPHCWVRVETHVPANMEFSNMPPNVYCSKCGNSDRPEHVHFDAAALATIPGSESYISASGSWVNDVSRCDTHWGGTKCRLARGHNGLHCF